MSSAAVITFWQTPEDEREFFEFLFQCGEVEVFSARSFDSRSSLVSLNADELSADAQISMYVSLKGSILDRDLEPFNAQYRINAISASVIYFRRGVLKNGILGQANLAAYDKYFDPVSRALVAKPVSFLRFRRKLYSWVRKRNVSTIELNSFNYPATSKAASEYNKGRVSVGF